MATGTLNDFVVRDELLRTILVETIAQNVGVLAENGNSINVVTNAQEGNYVKTAFFDRPSGGVARRDPASTALLTPAKITQDEHIGVKLNRKYGPFGMTLDSFRKIGGTAEDFTEFLGRNLAEEMTKEMLNTTVAALVAAIRNNSGVVHDHAALGANKTASIDALLKGQAKFGDAWGRLVNWVNNSAVLHALMQNQAATAVGNVADITIINGGASTVGKPMFATDAPAFTTAGTPGEYHILGLVENAALVEVSEDVFVATDMEVLNDNLPLVYHGIWAYTLTMKGYSWDITNGGANPADSAVATGSNWDKVVASDKDTAGIAIDVDQS